LLPRFRPEFARAEKAPFARQAYRQRHRDPMISHRIDGRGVGKAV
jgi:hypothetical protein